MEVSVMDSVHKEKEGIHISTMDTHDELTSWTGFYIIIRMSEGVWRCVIIGGN